MQIFPSRLASLLTSLSTLVVLFGIVGCATPGNKGENFWPENLPREQAYYEDLYRQDKANAARQGQDDYLRWVKRFYLGWTLYPNGWHWLTDNALQGTPNPAEKRELEKLLTSLGVRIGGEWAKDSRHRQVNTSHLMTWGNALKLATKQGQQIDMARRISHDVDDLLAYRMEPDMIDFDRYSQDDPSLVAFEDDPFDL